MDGLLLRSLFRNDSRRDDDVDGVADRLLDRVELDGGYLDGRNGGFMLFWDLYGNGFDWY